MEETEECAEYSSGLWLHAEDFRCIIYTSVPVVILQSEKSDAEIISVTLHGGSFLITADICTQLHSPATLPSMFNC